MKYVREIHNTTREFSFIARPIKPIKKLIKIRKL
jgi:hypothetical protein